MIDRTGEPLADLITDEETYILRTVDPPIWKERDEKTNRVVEYEIPTMETDHLKRALAHVRDRIELHRENISRSSRSMSTFKKKEAELLLELSHRESSDLVADE
jgi:hypothetical protein